MVGSGRQRWLIAIATVVVLSGCTSAQPSANSSAPSATTPTATASPPPTSLPSASAAPAVTGWLGYHSDPSRTGAIGGEGSAGTARPAWTAHLGAAVYGQPLVANGEIIAATERNRVVALSSDTGKVLWSTTLGAPLTNVAAAAGCGNVDPLGITSTPVIDPANSVVYVVGEISDGGGAVHHQLEGLNLETGRVVASVMVDPPLPSGEKTVNLLQRAGLAFANGRVYVSYGGNDGDCGSYHGWVVGVPVADPTAQDSFEVASDGEGGAIWESGGAPAIDASGDLYVTTGNANPDPPEGGPDPKKYTESVVKLSPTLAPLASFKDRIAGGDEDLATGNPVLLPNGQLFAVGKTDVGYVLRQSDLSVVATIPNICGSNPDGGPAYDASANRLYVPCQRGGIQEVDLTTHRVGTKLSGANGAPILVGTMLWAAHYPDGALSEYDTANGARSKTFSLGTTVPHFVSPSAGAGLVLVGTDEGVSAFED